MAGLPVLWTVVQGVNDFPLRTAVADVLGANYGNLAGATVTLLPRNPLATVYKSFDMSVESTTPTAIIGYSAQAADFAEATGRWKARIRFVLAGGAVRYSNEFAIDVESNGEAPPPATP